MKAKQRVWTSMGKEFRLPPTNLFPCNSTHTRVHQLRHQPFSPEEKNAASIVSDKIKPMWGTVVCCRLYSVRSAPNCDLDLVSKGKYDRFMSVKNTTETVHKNQIAPFDTELLEGVFCGRQRGMPNWTTKKWKLFVPTEIRHWGIFCGRLQLDECPNELSFASQNDIIPQLWLSWKSDHCPF